MSHFTTQSKIETFINECITARQSEWIFMLNAGHLHEFEIELRNTLNKVYDFLCEDLLTKSSKECCDTVIERAKDMGGGKIQWRQMSIRIATGKQIKVRSPYVKRPGKNWVGSRHLLKNHWCIIGGSTPFLYDKVGFCAALGPSYDIANQTLNKFGVHIPISSIRDITNRLASKCFDLGEENLMLEEGESLSGKRVIISLDGGRTRIRDYIGEVNKNMRQMYKTPWCEPKLLVIDVVDKDGQLDRNQVPIYGCRFQDADLMNLLERYLKKLEINKAERVQIVADGAPWIWNQTKSLLRNLNVKPTKIIETLDYYHASEYVYQLVDEMPKSITKKKKLPI